MPIDDLVATGLIPDPVIRFFIRQKLARKLREETAHGDPALRKKRLIEELRKSPIALHTDEANKQHYEVPAEFFKTVLGKNLKYSCGLWDSDHQTLDQSEESMLDLYIERAEISNGQRVLDLGCGWGSLSLYLGEKFPSSEIVAVSNSSSQRQFIEERAAARQITNVRVITCDINDLNFEETFDRIVSVEMLEHVRNYEVLFGKIASWLEPEGRLFIHIFCHQQFAYPFESVREDDWMARNFFSGGMMPSADLFENFQENLTLLERWIVNGKHYEETCNAWLRKMDQHRQVLKALFAKVYGREAKTWWHYWRVFFMACAELFGYKDGTEWCVAHYLMRKK